MPHTCPPSLKASAKSAKLNVFQGNRQMVMRKEGVIDRRLTAIEAVETNGIQHLKGLKNGK
jgi:hypothetical protein